MSTAEKVLTDLEEITGLDQVQVDIDVPLFDEGLLDSLGAFQLIEALSKTFSIGISPACIDRERWATPRKIIAYMERQVGT